MEEIPDCFEEPHVFQSHCGRSFNPEAGAEVVNTLAALLTADGIRELDSRDSDGISVYLLWDSPNKEILIGLADSRVDFETAFGVNPDCASDAFAHPFAYLP